MPTVVLTLCLAALFVAVPASAQSDLEVSEQQFRKSMESFVEARLLESAGRLEEAADAYAEAHRLDPKSAEIRIRYASLLLDRGDRGRDVQMVELALELLDGADELDWYGKRVRAMALAEIATRRPERLEDAANALEEVVGERPDDPNLILTLAQVSHRLDRLDRAEELVRDLREARGGSLQLLAYHASLLRSLGRLDEAAELYAECVDEPHMAELCRQNRVDLLLELGRPADAANAMLGWLDDDELDQLLRAAVMLFEGGRPEQALGVIHRVLAQAPDSPRAKSLEALLLSNLGREEEAAARFRELLRKDNENLDLLLPLAWSLARAGRNDEARKVISRAWELVQDDAGSAQAIGVCLAAARVELEGDHALLAREWIGRVADPGSAAPEITRLLAETYRKTEQYGDGVAAMMRLQSALPEGAKWEAVAFEAEFRMRAGRSNGMKTLRRLLDSGELPQVGMAIQILQALERWDDVVTEANLALQTNPDSVPLLFARAAALERRGLHDEAADAFQKVLDMDPENAAAANYLGYMWADTGRNLDQALQLISKAVELDPENPAYLDSLGWVHYRLGNLGEAAHWLQRAVELGMADGTVLGHLGEVLLRSGQTDAARQVLQQSLDLGGDDAGRVRELLDTIAGGN